MNELKNTESFLIGAMPDDEAALFRAKMILYPQVRLNTSLMKKTFSVVRLFGRRRLRFEIQNVERTIFHHPEYRDFQSEIESIFLKH